MMNFIRTELERWASWKMAAVAFVAVAACMVGLFQRHERLGGLELFDSRGWYMPGEATALFDALDRLDANARLVYAVTDLTMDMAFPIAYGMLFAIVLFRLSQVPLYLLPIALAVFDVLENLTIAGRCSATRDSPSRLRGWPAASP